MARSVIVAAALLSGCAGGASSPDAGPSIAVESSDLVDATRAAGASSAADCARLDMKASALRAAIGALPAAQALTAAVKSATADFGSYDPLLFGEVHRSHDAFLSSGAIDDTQLDLLAIDLSHHMSNAGVSSVERQAIHAALFAFRSGAQLPAVRMGVADLMVHVADLLADVQACSPKP